ncbi:signal peptidase I [Candidatus Bathyarchaeota archaeon]|nr:signal peptidase I [Candidatus Bathyarchaeota archaeon]
MERENGDSLKEKLKRLWNNGLFRSVFTILMLMALTFAFQKMLVLALRTEYPLQTPISNSMYPTLKVGDLLIVQGGLSGEDIYADPKNGDIIVFRRPYDANEFIVHRAIEKKYDERRHLWLFKTKGDNNLSPDPWGWISEKEIIGKVIFVIPYLGYIKIYLGNRYGIFVIVALLLAFIILENRDLISKEKDENNERSINQPPKDI